MGFERIKGDPPRKNGRIPSSGGGYELVRWRRRKGPDADYLIHASKTEEQEERGR